MSVCQAVYLLEREWAHLEISLKEKGENPVISIAKLVLGILCALLSVLWLLHILLYNIVSRLTGDLVPITAFFNDILIAMERTGFFMLSLAAYAILVVYLMACVVKGCFKFGMRVGRVPTDTRIGSLGVGGARGCGCMCVLANMCVCQIFFLFPIHPMKPHETHMNTFLFNVMLILISAGAIVQFSQVRDAGGCTPHHSVSMVWMNALWALLWVGVCGLQTNKQTGCLCGVRSPDGRRRHLQRTN